MDIALSSDGGGPPSGGFNRMCTSGLGIEESVDDDAVSPAK